MVAVAQLVESRIVIPVVVGSSPISHPKLNPLIYHFSGFLFAYDFCLCDIAGHNAEPDLILFSPRKQGRCALIWLGIDTG